MWKKENLCALLVGIILVQPLWKTVWNFHKKLKMELLLTQQFHFWEYIQIIPKHEFRIIYPPLMFIAALFAMAKIWKQPKCIAADE